VLSNTAQGRGGGVYGVYEARMIGNVFQGNACVASGCQGGGLFLDIEAVPDYVYQLSNITVLSNTAQANGGGIYATDGLLFSPPALVTIVVNAFKLYLPLARC